jgi:Spy/CpxP family protein refolding chaperone
MNLFCVLTSIALLASTAMAQQRGRRSSTPGGLAEARMMKQKAEELGLSDETLAKIDAALEANAAEEAKIREQTAAAIDGLNEVLAKKLPSEKELMAASNKVGESASKARALKLKSVLEMRSLLTPEQLEKFMEHRQKVTSRR